MPEKMQREIITFQYNDPIYKWKSTGRCNRCISKLYTSRFAVRRLHFFIPYPVTQLLDNIIRFLHVKTRKSHSKLMPYKQESAIYLINWGGGTEARREGRY